MALRSIIAFVMTFGIFPFLIMGVLNQSQLVEHFGFDLVTWRYGLSIVGFSWLVFLSPGLLWPRRYIPWISRLTGVDAIHSLMQNSLNTAHDGVLRVHKNAKSIANKGKSAIVDRAEQEAQVLGKKTGYRQKEKSAIKPFSASLDRSTSQTHDLAPDDEAEEAGTSKNVSIADRTRKCMANVSKRAKDVGAHANIGSRKLSKKIKVAAQEKRGSIDKKDVEIRIQGFKNLLIGAPEEDVIEMNAFTLETLGHLKAALRSTMSRIELSDDEAGYIKMAFDSLPDNRLINQFEPEPLPTANCEDSLKVNLIRSTMNTSHPLSDTDFEKSSQGDALCTVRIIRGLVESKDLGSTHRNGSNSLAGIAPA